MKTQDVGENRVSGIGDGSPASYSEVTSQIRLKITELVFARAINSVVHVWNIKD